MSFPSIHIEGAILSPDILDRLDDNAAGQRPADFALPAGASLKDEITRVWADAQDYWRIYQRKLADIPAVPIPGNAEFPLGTTAQSAAHNDTTKNSCALANTPGAVAPSGNPQSAIRTPQSYATTETRNLWIVPLLGLLGYQLERQPAGPEINGKIYPFSHVATNRANTLVHIIGSRNPAGLDRRDTRSGGPRMSAHAMVQEYLNLTDHLYALVTDGHRLRLLRDSSRLVKLTYLEFDLDRIFTDGLTPDFRLLYRILHATRLPAHVEDSSRCLIERYHQDSIEQGTRIRDGLRAAVTETIKILGTGFLDPRNGPAALALRQSLRDNTLTPQQYYRQLLRLIYRILFLMVLEDRRLVFPPDTPREKSDLYYRHYSLQRLRRLATNRAVRQSRHHDAWLALRAIFTIFEKPETAAELGTSALGGHLFRSKALGTLPTLALTNDTLFTALDRLCHFYHPETQQRTAVNFGALATEEFGSVYESLLELHPVITDDANTPRFDFKQSAGNERKTTASYYTHPDLVENLLNTALIPVIDQRLRDWKQLNHPSPADALLDLKICDPACGSGHFLIAAAQRLARRLALVRANHEEPSVAETRQSLRDVISHCIYGVDLNPMAVELCRIALWLEAAVPGHPLTFLEHHIKTGNSLIGATPALIRDGIPDEAYTPISGDTKEACKWMKKLNKDARDTQQTQADLFAPDATSSWQKRNNLPAAYAAFEAATENTYTDRIIKEIHYAQLIKSDDYLSGRQLCDAWCAAFVWPKTGVTYGQELHTEHLRRLEKNPHDLDVTRRARIRELATQYGFFHFHLEFPQVFREPAPNTPPEHPHSGLNGGFDCILANPPWEHVELKEKEFFAERAPKIAEAGTGAERKRMIAALEKDNPKLFQEYLNTLRKHDANGHFMGNSGCYPLCGRGRINTYTIFAENNRLLLNSTGRMGCVLPSGIATDDTTKFFFQDVIDRRSLVSLYDFENKNGLFPDVHRSFKFCLFTAGSPTQPTADAADFAFFCHDVADLRDEAKRFTLSPDDIALLNPNTRTCPIFRTRADAELTKAIYRRVPILVREARNGQPEQNPWGIIFKQGLFNMTSDSHLFRTRDQLEADGWRLDGNIFRKEKNNSLPLYEAKMYGAYDHRLADVVISKTAVVRQGQPDELSAQEHENPHRLPMPRYWIAAESVDESLGRYRNARWILTWRDITASTNERTAITTIIPKTAAGDTALLALFETQNASLASLFLSGLSSFSADYIVRQKMGGIHLKFHYFRQITIPTLQSVGQTEILKTIELQNYITPRVLELTYTAWDMQPFARDCGYDGPPFRWDESRRFILRCELDAAFFHLYLPATPTGDWQPARRDTGAVVDETGEQLAALKRYFPTPRDAVAYIMDTFPIVKRKDESEHDGAYRTKDKILEIYDALATARRTGKPFVSELTPPLADPACAHIVVAAEPEMQVAPIAEKKQQSSNYQDTAFTLPMHPRHGRLRHDLYTNYWMHSALHLEPNGMSADQLIDTFRLLLTKDSRKAVSSAGDKNGAIWLKSFNQTDIDLATMLASLLNRVRDNEIKVATVDGMAWLTASPNWNQSSTEWIRADAEIALRAMLDTQLKSDIIPFILTDTAVQNCITKIISNVA